MNKKGLIIRIGVIVIILILLSIEIYLLVKPRKNTNLDNNKNEIKSDINDYQPNPDDLKYITDATTSYFKNGLNYKVEQNNNYYYVLIDGLKDKELETKINTKIKELVNTSSLDNNAPIYNNISASYNNVLSVTINKYYSTKPNFTKDDLINRDVGGYILNTYNIDLNTGNILNINDLIYDINSLKEELVSASYDMAIEDAGFICTGGPCTNPYPDYSEVEDFTFKIISKFNRNDYKFYFDERYIYLVFDNLDSKAPSAIYDNIDESKCMVFTKDSKSGCVYINDCNDDSCYKTYVDLDHKRTSALFKIDMVSLADNILIYDKYLTNDSLYNNDNLSVDRKFTKQNNDGNTIKEDNKTLIDYDADIYEENVESITKKLVYQEMLELQTADYNIYSISGSFYNISNYTYVYYNVYHYSLNQDNYLKNKEKIYLNKFTKREEVISGPSTYNGEYSFLKEYNDKNSLYFYIIDNSTNKEVNSIDILNKDYNLKNLIPDNWVNLGKYKTKEDLINSMFITYNNIYSSKDRLILDIKDSAILLEYAGKENYLCQSYDECDKLKKEMFNE